MQLVKMKYNLKPMNHLCFMISPQARKTCFVVTKSYLLESAITLKRLYCE